MITPAQSRGARGLLQWTRERLADEAGVGLSTITSFELEQRSPIRANLAAIHNALETGGVEFIPENGGGAGVRLKKVLTMRFMKFELGQKYRSKRDPEITAEVLQLLDEGHDAWLEVRKDGQLRGDGDRVKYAQFIDHWELVVGI